MALNIKIYFPKDHPEVTFSADKERPSVIADEELQVDSDSNKNDLRERKHKKAGDEKIDPIKQLDIIR